LVELFSIHGIVNTVDLVTDKETGEPKGYGFITMNDDAGANRAIQTLNGIKMGGRTISVRFADEKPPVARSKGRPDPKP
jgi:RNA recognition motif-containing protein